MNFSLRFVGLASCTWIFVVACGGKVPSGPSGTAGAGPGAGGAMGSGGMGGGGTSNCDPACRHIIESGCTTQTLDKCVTSCETARTENPNCTAVFDAFLGCLGSAKITCDPSSDTVDLGACKALGDQAKACQNSNPPPPPPPPPIGDGGPSSCDSFPRPPAGMICSGTAGGGSAVTSGGQAPTCISQCYDSGNNEWASNCTGSTCSCTYNGREYCNCTLAGPSCLGTSACCPSAN
jgi:hypothetical protein